MPKVYPKDTLQKRNERKSFQVFLPLLNSECWEHLGSDHNYTFEYIEGEEYKGYRVLCQLKGRTNPEIRNDTIVFDFPVKTANYAIGCPLPFILIID